MDRETITYLDVIKKMRDLKIPFKPSKEVISDIQNSIQMLDEQKLKSWLQNLEKKWLSSGRKFDQFIASVSNRIWLKGSFIIKQSYQKGSSDSPKSLKIKELSELCERSKQRQISKLVSTSSTELIAQAFLKTLKVSKAKIMDHQKLKISKALNVTPPPSKLSKISPEAALCMIIRSKLSKRGYSEVRNTAINNVTPIFPEYSSILAAKKKCYLKSIEITEDKVECEPISLSVVF